jgi:hypothetical protein
MRESCMYGSARGAPSNGRPYRDRRAFITLIGGATAWPLAARAQQPRKVPHIGFLNPLSRSNLMGMGWVDAFRSGLHDLGYVEGKNIIIEYRWSEGKYDRLPGLIDELVQRGIDILVTYSTPATRAAKQATTEGALHAALTAGTIAGAGIDVFDPEPPLPDHPLLRLANLVTSPHMAGVTRESIDRMAVQAAYNVLSVFDGKPIRENAVNPEVFH